MTGFRKIAYLAALVATLAVPACAGPFDQCVKPVVSQITWTGTATELGQLVAAVLVCDGGFNPAALPACAVTSLEALATSLGPQGTQVVNCIIAYYAGGKAGSPAVQERARAAAVRRGIKLGALDCRAADLAMSFPKADREAGTAYATPAVDPGEGNRVERSPGIVGLPGVSTYVFPGPSDAKRMATCDTYCGTGHGLPVEGGGCECWRGAGRDGRWVAAR